MLLDTQSESIERMDEGTFVIYLEVPGAKVVLLQAYFELYEGVGIVRTLSIRKSLVCVLTTPSLIEDCVRVLEEIQSETQWRPAARPSSEDRERYLGYFSHASDNS